MKIQLFPGVKPIEICYSSRYFNVEDTLPVQYTDCKLSFLLSDGWSIVAGGKISPVNSGDILAFSPPEIHYAKINRSGIFRYLDIYIPEDYFDSFNGDASELMVLFSDKPNKNIIKSPKNRTKILSETEQLIDMLCDDKPQKELRLFCGIMQMLMFVSALYKQQEAVTCDTYLPKTAVDAIRYIENNFTEEISLQILADAVGCSITYLTRTFRQSTGKSVHTFLTEYRLHEAQQLLAHGATVTESCYSSGFTDCSGFIKIFKKHIGCTPLEYKKKISV